MSKRGAVSIAAFLVCVHGQDAALEHARAVNLERAAKLPGFVAEETAVRYKSRHTDPPQWQHADTIESEIAVQGGGFTRQNVRLNLMPWNKPNFPEFTWSVRFGYELSALFDPRCPNQIEFEDRTEIRGRPALAYRFSSPPDGCFGVLVFKNGLLSFTKRYNPARRGRFLISDPEGSLVRFEIEALDVPKWMKADPTREVTTWEYVTIGDRSYLLPVAFEIFGGFVQRDLWHVVVVEYKNHRHFEASTNLTFQPF